MSAAAPVRCPRCNRVVFGIVHGIAEGKCCGRRITAQRRLGGSVRITQIDAPPRTVADSELVTT